MEENGRKMAIWPFLAIFWPFLLFSKKKNFMFIYFKD
jgi:hypothetical protein